MRAPKVKGGPSPSGAGNTPNAHGDQNLYKAIQNSCNPAFIDIGQKLGAENFLKYYKAFGLDKRTGIDLPGEGTSIFHDEERFLSNKVDLATASFGQNFQISPIQLITAVSAVANGGNLMQPYIVKEILAEDGSIVKSTEPTVVRQISEETSELMCDILKAVSEGTGKKRLHRRLPHCGQDRHFGKKGETGGDRAYRLVCSFLYCLLHRQSDPQVAVLVVLDEPMVQQKTGGITAAPVVRRIMADILPYIGVEPAYSADELALQDIAVPNVTGKTRSGSGQRFGKSGPDYRVVGDGDTVTDQVPSYGAKIPGTAQVVLYMGGTKTGRAGLSARCNRPFRGRGPVSAGAGRPLYEGGPVRQTAQAMWWPANRT